MCVCVCVCVCVFLLFICICAACMLTLKSLWHDHFIQVYSMHILFFHHPLLHSSPFPVAASHFQSSSPLLLLNKLFSRLRSLLVHLSCCWHSYLPVYIFSSPCVTLCLSASITPPTLLFAPPNLSMSFYDIVMNWQFLFFFPSLAANSINKMPSSQLSFPITAPRSVRMRVAERLVKVFLCAGM